VTDAQLHRDTTDDGCLYVQSTSTFNLFDQLQPEASTDEALRALCADVTAGACRDQVQDSLITVVGKVYVSGTYWRPPMVRPMKEWPRLFNGCVLTSTSPTPSRWSRTSCHQQQKEGHPQVIKESKLSIC
jgi:hypothetical protein